jgi:hypothetical protein
MIDFSRSLDTAWERTKVILFQGDGAKWALIGCNAFLMMMGRGGVSLNNSIPFPGQQGTFHQEFQTPEAAKEAARQALLQMQNMLESPWTILAVGLTLALLAAWVVMLWVGSRGEFMFLDNVVRNRAAVAEPWKRYARQGNIWFLVSFGLMILSLVLTFGGIGVLLAEAWTWIFNNKTPQGPEVALLVVTFLGFLAVIFVYAILAFLVRGLVLPLYFKQTMSLGECFGAVFGLMGSQPLSLFMFVLVSIGLGFLQAIITVLVIIPLCCVLCWASCVPFFGSVVVAFVICQAILPVSVFVRCFQLECLAQFGPQFDVWNVDVQPAPGSFNPPPQLG